MKFDMDTVFACPTTAQRVNHLFEKRDETPLVDQVEVLSVLRDGSFCKPADGHLLNHEN